MNLNGFVRALWAKNGISCRLGLFFGGMGVIVELDMWLALRFNAGCTLAGGLGWVGREECVD